jgi:hypothetical protein
VIAAPTRGSVVSRGARRLAAACAAVVAVGLHTAAPLAHPPPEALGITWGAGGDRVVIRTTRGLLISTDAGERFRYLCPEALSASDTEPVPMTFTSEGRLLVSTFAEAIRHGSADFCTFDPGAPPVAGRRGLHLAGPAAGTGTFYLLTGDSPPTESFFSSTDDGAHWSPLGPAEDIYTRIVIAPSDLARLYRSGVVDDPDAGYPPLIAASSDGGVTWAKHAIPLAPEELDARVVGVHPTEPDRVFVRTVARSVGLPERLLMSRAAGADLTPVLTAPDLLAFAGAADGTLWAGSSAGLHRSVDAGETFAPIASASLIRIACLEVHGDRLFACAIQDNALGVSVSSDGGQTFETFLRFSDVTERLDCPPASQGGARCDEAFTEWQLEVTFPFLPTDPGAPAPEAGADGEAPPTEPPTLDAGASSHARSGSDAGCACGLADPTPRTGAAAGVLGSLGALWLRRRGRVNPAGRTPSARRPESRSAGTRRDRRSPHRRR